jgi:hypothetical protein
MGRGGLGRAGNSNPFNEESKMRKLLSILVAAMFAVSTGTVFAASHAKAGMDKEAKQTEKAEKKEMKAEKKEKKAKKAKKAKKEEEKK